METEINLIVFKLKEVLKHFHPEIEFYTVNSLIEIAELEHKIQKLLIDVSYNSTYGYGTVYTFHNEMIEPKLIGNEFIMWITERSETLSLAITGRVKELCKERNWKLSNLAEALGESYTLVREWLSRENTISLEAIGKLEKVLQTNLLVVPAYEKYFNKNFTDCI